MSLRCKPNLVFPTANQLAHFALADRQKCVSGCTHCCWEVQSSLAMREGHTQPGLVPG